MVFHFKEVLSGSGVVSRALIWVSSPGGKFGVSLFFLISGYVIALVTEGKNVKSCAFLMRRLLRILPLATLTTFMCYLLKLLLDSSAAPSLKDLLGSLFFLPLRNGFPPFFGYRVLSVQWTLTYELIFYVVFAVSLAISQTHRLLLASAILGVMVFGLQAFYGYCTLDAYSSPLATGIGAVPGLLSLLANPLFMFFVLGMWICGGQSLVRQHKIRLLPLVSFATIIISVWGLVWSGSIGLVVPGLAIFLFLVMLSCENAIRALPSKEVFARLGDISYSLYLINPIVLFIYQWLRGRFVVLRLDSDLLVFFILVSVSIVLSELSYRWIELPGIRLGKRMSAP